MKFGYLEEVSQTRSWEDESFHHDPWTLTTNWDDPPSTTTFSWIIERSRRGVRQCDELFFNGQYRYQNSRSFAKGVFFAGIVWINKHMYVYIIYIYVYISTDHPFHSSHFSQVSRNQASLCFTLKKKATTKCPNGPGRPSDSKVNRSSMAGFGQTNIGRCWVWPLPSTGDHQDYSIFTRESL